ncbi:unnamed protein product [marine sediment metagenome]|uniref:Lipoprotein n=1 Tax=marine sediment metagenome TaxID=412755 RepID=X0SZA6_9ZZZZ
MTGRGPALMMLLTVLLVGCGGDKEPEKPMPIVTLVERRARKQGENLLLRFKLEHMDRYDWEGKALASNILDVDDEMIANGPVFPRPAREFTIELDVTKKRGDATVTVKLRWGFSKAGTIIEAEQPDLLGPDGLRSVADLPAYKDKRLTQVLETCVAPDKSVRFNPDEGLDLIKLGYGENAVGVKIWAAGKIVK